jgi:23S rRNA pseudouridine2605 synthase
MAADMRLQKYLARAGVASRRASEELIQSGRVKVDGEVVTVLGTKVDPQASVVEVDGQQVQLEESRWIMLHKPPGCLCTRSDPERRPTVYDLIGPEQKSLFHVGRLDYMSEGMLLLTNDGTVAEPSPIRGHGGGSDSKGRGLSIARRGRTRGRAGLGQ